MDSIQPIILIVDDEKHTRDGLRRLLENDYDVYVAGVIASAMSVLEREHVDLVLTDLRLGGEDGMQLIDRALKMPQPPICIMMTDRRLRHFQRPINQLHAVFAAEAQIGQDKIDMFALENAHGAGNDTRHVNVVIVLEQAAQSVPRMFFVINDQDDGLDGIHE